MKTVLSTIVISLQIVLISAAIYQLMIALWGFASLPRRRIPRAQKELTYRFLCLTFAHNEEAVIEAHVNSLREMRYPRVRFDCVVVADNCADRTAEVAEAAGAIVWSRVDPRRRGKGYAMKWALCERANLAEYDAVCVFDADNLVEPNFLAQMSRHLRQGHQVIQAYLDTKNPWDSWISASYALAYWYMNRFWQRPRTKLGLSGALGGTGFCVTTEMLRKLPWDTQSLTEDLEYSVRLVLGGNRVHWTPYTRVYDEKPVGLRQTFPQRIRWLQGHWNAALGHTIPLIRTILSKDPLRKKVRAFDFLVYLWQPVLILVTGVNLLLLPAKIIHAGWYSHWLGDVLPASVWGGIAIIGLLLPLLAFALEDADWRAFVCYPVFLLFNLTWVPIAAVGLWRHRRTEWAHTRHTCSRQLEDLQLAGVASFPRFGPR